MKKVNEKLPDLIKFLEQPGINRNGLFREIGMRRELVDVVIRRGKLTEKFYLRILPQLEKYGYKDTENN